MLFLKRFKDAKFVVDGNAFQTFITLSTKNFCLMLAVHLGLNSLFCCFRGGIGRSIWYVVDPGGRFHVESGCRPTDSSTWRSMAWCAGMLSGNLD